MADQLMNITPDFAAAVSKLQGMLPKVERDRRVDVDTKDPSKRYGYSYATLAHITELIMPKLSQCGLAYTAYPGAGSDGKMSLRYFLLHAGGGFISGEFPLAAGDRGIQGMGSAITYSKRYCLMAVTGLAAEEDDDAAAAQAEDEARGKTAQRRDRSERARSEQASANTARRREASEDVTVQPADPGESVTGPQQQKLVMQFKDLGISDRDEKLSIVSGLLARPIGSIRDLSMSEARELITSLDAVIASENPQVTLENLVKVATTLAEESGGES